MEAIRQMYAIPEQGEPAVPDRNIKPYGFEYKPSYIESQARYFTDLAKRMEEYATNPQANPMEMPLSFDSGGMFGTFGGPKAAGWKWGMKQMAVPPEAPREVLRVPVGGERVIPVVKNPKDSDLWAINEMFREKYPNAPKGEPKSRSTYDKEGNQYLWMSDDAMHFQVEDYLKSKHGIEANQNLQQPRETVPEGSFSALFDKKPRFEIDDSAAKLTGIMSGKLGEVLDHPELFKNYPHFKDRDVALKIDPNLPGAIGNVAPSGRIILSAPSKESLLSELLHEVQHPIQDLEGFAKGANLQTYGYSSSPESVLKAADRLEGEVSFYEEMKKLNNILSEQKRRNVPAAVTEFERRYGYTPAMPDKTEYLYQGRTPEQLKQDALYRARHFLDSVRSNDKIDGFIKDNINFYEKDMQEVKKAYKSYKNTAGEIESRDVANRAAYSQEQRQAIPPYSSEAIPLSEYIVR